MGKIAHTLDNFDKVNGISSVSGAHPIASVKKDMALLVKELAHVFHKSSDYVPESFPNPRDPLHAISHEDLKHWILDHVHV